MQAYKIGMAVAMQQINKVVAEKLHQAVGAAAQQVQSSWADRVMKAPGIWAPERQAYINSIKWDFTGPFSATVASEYKLADEIETGRPARDMKVMLQTSRKTRQGKNGRYLIIPMRHNVPGNTAHAQAMPANVYAVARQMQKSRVTGQTTRASASDHIVPQSIYQWGEALPAGMAPKLKASHTTDIYAGMRRFDTSSGKSKSSAYLTFRVMSEKSSGWIVAAKPGLFIARQLAIDSQPAIEQSLLDAFKD